MATQPTRRGKSAKSKHVIVALGQLRELADIARAAYRRRREDTGEFDNERLRAFREFNSYSEVARGFLMALVALGLLTDTEDGMWFEYITSQRDFPPMPEA